MQPDPGPDRDCQTASSSDDSGEVSGFELRGAASQPWPRAADGEATRTSDGGDDSAVYRSTRLADAAPVERRAAPLQFRDPDRYQIVAEHGRGGLGRVYRARDRELGRDVALKELLNRGSSGEQRFFREALITARLEHPGIVPVHEAGRWPDGTPFYAMKLVAGRSLKELVDRCTSLEERLALLPNVVAVADAIAYAHDRKIIHRDLKPSNVIVGDFGETVVIDWGLAKDLSAPGADVAADGGPYRAVGSSDGLTAVGAVLGTPAYMSPEQARGEPVDERTDLYAIGAILAHLCTGATAAGPVRRDSLAHVPRDLRSLVERATAADPVRRFQSAKALADELRAYLRGLPVASHRYSPRERARRWLARHRAVVRLAAVAAALLAIAMVWASLKMRAERDIARQQRDLASRAQARAERDAQARLLAQARAMLGRDPAATLEILAEFPQHVAPPAELRTLAAEAVGLGAARHILRGHDGIVLSLVVADDGELISVGREGTMRAWDLTSGRSRTLATGVDGPIPSLLVGDERTLITTRASGDIVLLDRRAAAAPVALTGHRTFIYDLDLSADRGGLVSASADGTIRVWNLHDRSLRATIATPDPVGRVRFVGDDRLIGCDLAGALREWRIGGGETRLGRCDVAQEVGSSLALSPDERWLVVGDADHRPVVYDLATGARRALTGHGAALSEVAIDAERGVVAVAGLDGAVRYSDLRTGAILHEVRHDGPAYRVLLTASGYGASVGEDGLIRMIELDGSRRLTLRGHDAQLWALASDRAGTRLVSADHLGEIRTWDLDAGAARAYRAHQERVIDLAASADGRWIATSSRDSTIVIHDRARGDDQSTLVAKTIAMPIGFDPTGGQLALAGDDGRMWLWTLSQPAPTPIRGGGASPDALAWSPGGDQVIIGDAAGGVTGYDLAGARWRELAQLGDGVAVLGFDGAGRLLAGTVDGRIAVIEANRPVEVFAVHRGRIADLEPLRDGGFASGGDDGVVRAWSRNAGAWRSTVIATGAPVRDLDSAGGVIAVAAGDGTLTVIDAGAVRQLRGVHVGEVLSVVLSRDGAEVFSGGDDGRLVSWVPRTGAHAVVRGHAGHIRELALVDDDRVLLSAGLDGVVRAWDRGALVARQIPGSPEALRRWLTARTPFRFDRNSRTTRGETAARVAPVANVNLQGVMR